MVKQTRGERQRVKVNWSAHKKSTLSFNCNSTTQNKTNTCKAPMMKVKACSTHARKMCIND